MAQELARPVAERGAAGGHRQAAEVAPQVVGEPIHRAVAVSEVLGQGLEHDAVEVAFEPPAQRPRLVRLGGGVLRRHRRRRAVLPHLARHQRPAARGRRPLLAHRADVLEVVAVEAVGRVAAQQAIEQDAQGVDIGRHRHRQAAHLLGAGPGRGQGLVAGAGGGGFAQGG